MNLRLGVFRLLQDGGLWIEDPKGAGALRGAKGPEAPWA
jgi:hypothetical protein